MQWLYILADRRQRCKIDHPRDAFRHISKNQINILGALTLVLYIYFVSDRLVQINVVSADTLKANASSSQSANEDHQMGKQVPIPTNPPVKRNDTNKSNNTGTSLDCEPGEQRQFNYESSTRVWGSSKQRVRLRATLKIKCMEPSSNVTLKYLAEIVSLEPSFGHAAEDDSFTDSSSSQNGKSSKLRHSIERQSQARSRLQQPVDLQSMFSNQNDLKSFAHANDPADLVVDDNFHTVSSDNKPVMAHWVEYDTRKPDTMSSKLRAEPLLDEFADTISQTATRVKRSVTDWFGRTWSSVKEFFVGIFQSSERSTVSRNEILRETGIDIAGQCKIGSEDKHKGAKIPIDESVFEDLGPEYYMSASLDPSASTSYDINPLGSSGVPLVGESSYSGFGYNDDEDVYGDKSGDDEDAQLSFFDDPKRGSNTLGHRRRSKRAASSTGRVGKQSKQSTGYEDGSYERQLYAPFVFTQSRTGKIIDIRFASNATDLSIKNFKRHLCDLFATNLDPTSNKHQQTKPTSTNEVSPIGKHSTKYLLDTNGANSDAIKQLLMETGDGGSINVANNNENNVKQRQFAVKVLAMVGATGLYESRESVNGGVNNDHGNASSSGTNANNNCGFSKATADECPKVSTVLRSINATSNVRLSSKATASLSSTTSTTDPDQIQVQVKQVQKISDGRLTATAGRMVMSLAIGPPPLDEPNYDTIDDYDDSRDVDGLRIEDDVTGRSSRKRWTRQVSPGLDSAPHDNGEQAGFNVADLLAVSSAFSMQLVPAGSNSYVDTAALSIVTDQVHGKKKGNGDRKRRSADIVSKKPTITQQQASKLGTTTGTRYTSSSLLVTKPPTDANERERVLQEWRQLETRMQMTKPSQLLAEQSDSDDGSIQRLEILRNQIKMRLNEEFVRQRVRDLRLRQHHQKQVAALQGNAREARQYSGGQRQQSADDGSSIVVGNGNSNNGTENKFGLSLTQLILGGAITARRKGAIYDAIEETLELELNSGEENAEGSIGRLLRDTVRMDRLRSFCRSAISDYEDMTRSLQKSRIEILTPFNVSLVYPERKGTNPLAELNSINESKRGTGKESSSARGVKQKRLQQCKQVLGLVLRVGEPKAADLVVELIDICNGNLLSFAARHEELGYGPISRYYRSVRQQFIELLALYGKPSDLLLDKLMARLQFGGKHPSMDFNADKSFPTRSRARDNDRDFDYVPKETVITSDTSDRRKELYNKTLLREDDHNNNDGAGSLVMTITALAAKPTISRSKRTQVINKLLDSLKNSKCSLFDGPDLDIIESMSNFGNTAAAASSYQSKQSLPQQPIDDLVHKIVQLAKRCSGKQRSSKSSGDQYIIACVHALSGQLNHTASQRFLVDQLRSPTASCTLKSEILLTLIEAVESAELRHLTLSTSSWPMHGLNRVDDTLLDIVVPNNNRTVVEKQERNCLLGLIGQYFIKKQLHTPIVYQGQRLTLKVMAEIFRPRRRHKRGVVNDNEFWDEAQCKRWTMPTVEGTGRNSTDPDIADRTNDTQSIRKRHKCIASKSFGPKSAQAVLRAEVVNDLVGSRDENKFLARFRLAAQFLGNKIDIGRMYLWHQRKTTRAHANILGRSLWDTSHECSDKPPQQMLYMPLFDFNLWLVKVSLGLRLHAEMGFQSNCDDKRRVKRVKSDSIANDPRKDRLRQATSPKTSGNDLMDVKDQGNTIGGSSVAYDDELELYPTIGLRASGEASAKFVVARAGMSVASNYAYRGSIRVSRQPESCMSIDSSHQPMNLTFASWFQLWDSDCHYWGSRHKAEPSATKWSVPARQPSVWIADECLNSGPSDISNKTLGAD